MTVFKFAKKLFPYLFLLISLLSFQSVYAIQDVRLDCSATPPTAKAYTSAALTDLKPPLPSTEIAKICAQHQQKLISLQLRCVSPIEVTAYVQSYIGGDTNILRTHANRNFKFQWAGCGGEEEYVACTTNEKYVAPFFLHKPEFLNKTELPAVTILNGSIVKELDTPYILCQKNATGATIQLGLKIRRSLTIGRTRDELIMPKCEMPLQTTGGHPSLVTEQVYKSKESFYKDSKKNPATASIFSCGIGEDAPNLSILSQNCQTWKDGSPVDVADCETKKRQAYASTGSYEQILHNTKYAFLCGKVTKETICARDSKLKVDLQRQCGMTDEAIRAFCSQSSSAPINPRPASECDETKGLHEFERVGGYKQCSCKNSNERFDGAKCAAYTKSECERDGRNWVPGDDMRDGFCELKCKEPVAQGKALVYNGESDKNYRCETCYVNPGQKKGFRPKSNFCEEADNDAPNPEACPKGKKQADGSCRCAQNERMISGGCQACPPGSTSNGNTETCVDPSGKVVPTPSPTCPPHGIKNSAGNCCEHVENGRCVDGAPGLTPPGKQCSGPSECSGHPCREGRCVSADNPDQTGRSCFNEGATGGTCGNGKCENGRCTTPTNGSAAEQRCKSANNNWYNGECYGQCPQGTTFNSGRCERGNGNCPQGTVQQGGGCVSVNQNDPAAKKQQEQQECERQGGEMVQGRCVPKQQKQQEQQKQGGQPQQQGMTPQQQQQLQQLQAMQECQQRQPQGAWVWNGYQCMPNPNYQQNQTQTGLTGGIQCNFFGADSIEVPAKESFTVTFDVVGAKKEIKVDTSPKSTTKYEKKDPSDTTTERRAVITPTRKGKLKVSLIVDGTKQSIAACKPIDVTVIDAVPQQTENSGTADTGGSYADTSNNNTGYGSNTGNTSGGDVIETPSDIIAKRTSNNTGATDAAKPAPQDDDAYAYLCKTLGIGCAKDIVDPTVIKPKVVDRRPSNEITINPGESDEPDLPNIGEGGDVDTKGPGQKLATDVGIDGDGKVHSAVVNYLNENGQYAPANAAPSGVSGTLNSSDDKGTPATEEKVGLFTRLWRWFIGLFGFGPAYAG